MSLLFHQCYILIRDDMHFLSTHDIMISQMPLHSVNYSKIKAMGSSFYVDILQVGVGMLLITMVGWILAKTKLFVKEDFKVLNSFPSLVGLPLLIFNALSKHKIRQISFEPLLNTILMNVSCHILILIVFLLPSSLVPNKLEYFISTEIASCYVNYIIIGLPIFTSIWGEESAKVAVICPFAHYFFVIPLYVVLARLFSLKKEQSGQKLTCKDVGMAFLKSLKTPVLIGAFAGLTWSAIGWTPPLFFSKLSQLGGDMVVGYSLLCIGSFLCENSIFACHWAQLIACLSLRFVFAPLLAMGWAMAFKFGPTLGRQCVILAALPLSTVAYVLAVSCGVGAGSTSSVVFWSVVLVVPVVMFWFAIMDWLHIFVE